MAENCTQIRDMTNVFNLRDLAAYQEHSVVSREIIRKPSGDNDRLCFRQGRWLERTYGVFAAVYLLEGEAEIHIDGKPYSVKEGKMIIMPTNKPHVLKAVSRYKMLLVMIK